VVYSTRDLAHELRLKNKGAGERNVPKAVSGQINITIIINLHRRP